MAFASQWFRTFLRKRRVPAPMTNRFHSLTLRGYWRPAPVSRESPADGRGSVVLGGFERGVQ